MKTITDHDLHSLPGGGDPISQPLSMPAGWAPSSPAEHPWITTVGEYLKYIAAPLAY